MTDSHQVSRLRNLDLMKTIAMVAVVSLHASTWKVSLVGECGTGGYVEYLMRILCEGVPIFVLVNGYLLLGKRSFVLRAHVTKTLTLIGLLLVWSVLLIVSKCLIDGDQITLGVILKNVFLPRIAGNKYIGVLWFLQSLVGLYLFVPVLKHVYDTNIRLFEYLFIVSLSLFCVCKVCGYVGDLLVGTGFEEGVRQLAKWLDGFGLVTANDFVLFFMFGGILRRHQEWIREHRLQIVIAGVLAWVAAYLFAIAASRVIGKSYTPSFNYSSPFMFVILPALFAACLGFEDEGPVGRLVTSFGSNTMGIYFLHTIVIVGIDHVYKISSFGLAMRLVVLAVVLVISWAISALGKKVPGVRWLFYS